MKIEHHIAISTIISGLFYSAFKSWELTVTSLIAGIFIDIDHIFDYLYVHGFHIPMKQFLDFFYKEKHQKITLLFHGWEWLIVLVAVTLLSDFHPWVAGMLIGYSHHIISDYIYSKADFCSYSLYWRWKNRFSSQVIFPRNRGYNP